MKPILVHVHIFYPTLWAELKRCLENITGPYHLYITMVEDHADLRQEILEFNSDAKILVSENRGFDIAPFIEVINSVDLGNYSYLIKLHTKRDVLNPVSINEFDMSGDKWRNALLSFINTPRSFKRCLKVLNTNPSVGMVNSYKLIIDRDFYDEDAVAILHKMLDEQNLPSLEFSFVAGSMFMARAELFKSLQGRFSISDFDESAPTISQLAHALERFLGYIVYLDNKKVCDPFGKTKKSKVFKKVKKGGGKRVVYLFGVKIYSYQRN